MFNFLGNLTFGITAETKSLREARRRMQRFGRAAEEVEKKTKKTTRTNTGLVKSLRNLESASVLAVGPLSGLGARVRSLGAILTRTNIRIALFIGGFTLLVVGVFKLISAMTRLRLEISRIEGRFQAVSGSAIAARDEFLFAAKAARKYAVDLQVTARNYSQLTAAAANTVLEGQATREIFLGITEAGAALRLSNQDLEGSFRAVVQMISKGTVQSEELRGQFGERIPGAMRLAGKALGVTTAKLGELLKKGEVIADEFLPKLAKVMRTTFGQAARANINTLSGQVSLLSTNWDLLLLKMDEVSGSSRIVKRIFMEVNETLEDMEGWLDKVGTGLENLAPAGTFAADIAQDIDAFLKLAEVVGRAPIGAVKSLTAEAQKSIDRMTIGLAKLLALEEKMRRTGLTAGLEGVIQRSTQLQQLIRQLTMRMEKLKEVNTKAAGSMTDFAEKAKRVFDVAKEADNLEKLFEQIKLLSGPDVKAASAAITEFTDTRKLFDGFKQGIMRMDALVEAMDLIRDVEKPEVLDALLKQLNDIGFAGDNLLEVLTEFIADTKLAEIRVKELNKRMEATPDILRETAQEFNRVSQRMKAMERGSLALEKLEEAFEIEDAVIKYREQLDKTILSFEEVDSRAQRYRETLMQFKEAEKVFEKQMELVDGVEEAFGNAFESIGSAIAEAFLTGEKQAINSMKIINKLLGDLFMELLNFALFDPVKTAFRGFLESALGTAGSSFGGAPPVPTALGGILAANTLIPARNATALTSESGPEGIFPLARTPSGALGVQAIGGGGGVNFNINIINNANTEVTTSAKDDGNGSIDINVMIDEIVAGSIRNGGATPRAIADTFGSSPRLTAR